MTIVELDCCYRIDDERGTKRAYFYWDTAQFPLPGGQTKEEAYEIARRCLYALGAEK